MPKIKKFQINRKLLNKLIDLEFNFIEIELKIKINIF